MCDYITPEIVPKSLFLNNLPLDVSKEYVLKFLEIFNLNESSLIIDEKILSTCGSLILCMNSEEDAEFAKGYLNKIQMKWKNRSKKPSVENLLLLVNKGNEL